MAAPNKENCLKLAHLSRRQAAEYLQPKPVNVFNPKQRNKRKGVSPLIATVLLIAFTLAIGAFMSTWLHDITKKQTEETVANARPECQFAALNFQNVSYTNSSTTLKITLENTGTKSVNVNGVRIIYDDDKITKASFNSTKVDAGDAIVISVTNSTDNGTIRSDLKKVRLITDCPNNNIEYSGDSISGAT